MLKMYLLRNGWKKTDCLSKLLTKFQLKEIHLYLNIEVAYVEFQESHSFIIKITFLSGGRM
ncbi:hypothetical protein [Shimazuella alba]|uniref:Uncharacterized protein n=1 Tax=Shimazuella alba TaxID=2690964 RepID=A0A6I4VTS8_9BACL|nr:hypothetical protein [Shimazuella alba]MXQ54977.1 hypothetical protein [Shimazuella alba]